MASSSTSQLFMPGTEDLPYPGGRRGHHPWCAACGKRRVDAGMYGPPIHDLNKRWFCLKHGTEQWTYYQNNLITAQTAPESAGEDTPSARPR